MKINWIKNIGNEITKKTAKTELVLKKKSPEILLGFGIVGIVGTVVIACKATLRADEVLEYHYHKMNDIHTAKDVADQNPADELEYDDKLYRQDIAFQYLRTAGSFVKLYAPAITLGTLSIACIITSRNIMQKRYLGVMAAYNPKSM